MRLFAPDDLTRDNIEPEIVRSSLDSVMLQLIRLGYNPYIFPFMTNPAAEALANSISLLEGLQCISRDETQRGTDREFAIAEYGRLFAELPFDPRLSAFVVDCFRIFDKLELASAIASILSAPGNIYFTGGATKEAKEAARLRVSTRASQFDSDLLCMESVFQGWYQAGATDQKSMCIQCNRKCPRGKGCRQCRVKYSMTEGLNNKVLDFVLSTSRSVDEIIKKAKFRTKIEKRTGVDDVHVVSECLERYFSEQLGEVLVPEHPPDGVRLDKVGVRARITNSSSFLQKIRIDPFRSFVALSVTQVPSGEYIIDRLHPVASMKHSDSPACCCIYRRDGVGHQLFRSFRTWSSQQMSRPEYYWSVCVYDSTSKALEVYNVENHRDLCHAEISSEMEFLIRDAVGQCVSQIVVNGTLEASFSAGLNVANVAPMQNTWRIQFHNLPIQAANEFRPWLSQFFGEKLLPKTAIRWAGAIDVDNGSPSGMGGTVIVSSEEVASGLLKKGEQYIKRKKTGEGDAVYIDDVNVASFLSNNKSHGSRVLAMCTDPAVTGPTLRNELGQHGVLNVLQLFKKTSSFTIYLRNLPVRCNKEWLQMQVRDRPVDITVKSGIIGASTREAFLQFTDRSLRDMISAHLFQVFSSGEFDTPVSFRDKKGVLKTRSARPEALVNALKDTSGSTAFMLVFGNAQQTDDFYTQHIGGVVVKDILLTLDCRGEVTIKYPELYPDIKEAVARIGTKFAVRTNIKEKLPTSSDKRSGSVLQVVFSGAVPSVIEKAISALKAISSSIVLSAPTDKQKAFYKELSGSDSFKQKIVALKLRVDWTKGPRGEIFGPRIGQGELMRVIADRFSDFEARYVTFQLSPGINSLFYKGKVGAAKFLELKAAWKDRCSLKHRLFSSDIVAHFPEGSTAADFQLLNSDIDVIVESAGGLSTKSTQTCVFCKKVSRACSDFSICGHSYCVRCLSSAVDERCSDIKCPACLTPVHVKDIKETLPGEQFAQQCSLSLRKAISNDKKKFQIRACPNPMCTGVLSYTDKLQVCGECSCSVCVMCESVNKGSHTGRSCSEVAKLSERLKNVAEQLQHIVADGEKFVRDNWSADLQPIVRVDINPGIFWNCQSYERFARALERGSDLKNGFFAWHGTAEAAIGPICDTGFSPKFRSGQAYGPGEYFGTHPNVSLGYAKGSSRLILAYILQSSQVKHVPDFCYVVLNPSDWSFSYCLPLLVVTFNNSSTPPFVIRADICGADIPSSSGSYTGGVNTTDSTDGDTPGDEVKTTKVVVDLERGFGGLKISVAESASISTVQYQAPYRWHWLHDDGSFRAYTDEINSLIETYYDAMLHKGGSHRVLTPPIVRYVDDVPQRYFIDFDKKQQVNEKTGYLRQISRKEVETAVSAEGRWYIMNDGNVWSRYELLIEGQIELAFSKYRNGAGGSKTTVTFPGRPEAYEIDFVQGLQRNTVSEKKRQVKRAS